MLFHIQLLLLPVDCHLQLNDSSICAADIIASGIFGSTCCDNEAVSTNIFFIIVYVSIAEFDKTAPARGACTFAGAVVFV